MGENIHIANLKDYIILNMINDVCVPVLFIDHEYVILSKVLKVKSFWHA